MRKEKKRRRAGKAARWRGIKGSVMIFAVFCLVTVISTILYEVLPLPKIPFLWGEDAFYQTIVMGMYNSLLDFAVFSILLTVLLKRQERADTVQRYLDDLDACRFWFSDQAAHRLRSLIQLLQDEGEYSLDLTKCYISEIILKKLRYEKCRMMGAVFSGSNLEQSTFVACNFQGAYCEKSLLRKCTFQACSLRLLKGREVDMRSSSLQDCDLELCDFTDADLRFAIIKNCSLKKVTFSGCNLERTNLLGCTNLCVEELVKCRSLRYAKLDPEILAAVQAAAPHLLN